jgi:hypothetical protein
VSERRLPAPRDSSDDVTKKVRSGMDHPTPPAAKTIVPRVVEASAARMVSAPEMTAPADIRAARQRPIARSSAMKSIVPITDLRALRGDQVGWWFNGFCLVWQGIPGVDMKK